MVDVLLGASEPLIGAAATDHQINERTWRLHPLPLNYRDPLPFPYHQINERTWRLHPLPLNDRDPLPLTDHQINERTWQLHRLPLNYRGPLPLNFQYCKFPSIGNSSVLQGFWICSNIALNHNCVHKLFSEKKRI